MLNNLIKIPNIYFDIKSSKNPDDDLIFMAKAKFFVSDARGFSSLVAEIQNYQKNCTGSLCNMYKF